MQSWQHIEVDPEREITVCCGSTETMISTLLAVSIPATRWSSSNRITKIMVRCEFCGAKPRYVKLRPPTKPDGEWHFDERELRAAFHPDQSDHREFAEQPDRQGVYP